MPKSHYVGMGQRDSDGENRDASKESIFMSTVESRGKLSLLLTLSILN